MSVIFAESVAITKSGLVKGFNGDNMNLNSKVISTQEADNGFKAAGSVKPPYFAVIASGNQQGFAEGAASAFNDYIKDINHNKENASEIISRYFDDMQIVADNCGIENATLSVGVVCVYDDCVIAAKSGNCHLLRYANGELFEIAIPDDESPRGFQFIETITNGEMFALIGEECSEDLNYYGIVEAFNSEADLKTTVKAFYRLLAENAKEKDCSVVLIKLGCDEENVYVAAPVDNVVAEDAYAEDTAAAVSVETEETVSSENEETAAPVAKEKTRRSLKRKILDTIPIVILVVLFGIAASLFVAIQKTKPASSPDITTEASTEPVSEIVSEEIGSVVTEEKTTISNGMVTVGDPEQGGNVNPVTTTRAPETTTRAPETTTRAPETTTQAPETTTQAPETTTQAPETTTQAPETTTQAPETTTQAPETTTQAPETTTEPKTTLSEPIAPETTTAVVDIPADEPVDVPEDEPIDIPADEPVDVPADEPVDVPADEPVEEPGNNMLEDFLNGFLNDSNDEVAETPVEDPVENPVDEPVDDIIDQIEEEPVG